MQLFVVFFACSFVPEQVSVSPCVIHCTVALAASFTEGERDGAVGIFFLYPAYDTAHDLIGKVHVLAALQDECAEAEGISVVTTGENIVLAKSVPLTGLVAPSDSAVQAVVFAYVANLDKSAYIHVTAVNSSTFVYSKLGGVFCALAAPPSRRVFPLVMAELFSVVELIRE